MQTRLFRFVLPLCVLSPLTLAVALGQVDAKKVSPDDAVGANVEVRFTDGGALRMAIAEEHLEFATPHGKLKIAVADLRRLDLATRLTAAQRKLLAQSLENLGNPQFEVREKAGADLLSLKEKAYPSLLEVSRSPDIEIATRGKDLLGKLQGKVPPQRLRFREKDVVFTSDSTISGKLEPTSLTATSPQFGPVQLNLADIASIIFLNAGQETELKMDGRYALATEVWLDTGLDVTEHVRLTITATGEIDMYPTSGYAGQYVGTPKGKKKWAGSISGMYEPGTLIGRIGEGGTTFLVKDQYEDSAPASGRLFLRAAGNTYNVETSGHYTIKIAGGVPGVPAPPKDEEPPGEKDPFGKQ